MRPQYQPGDRVMIGEQEAVVLSYDPNDLAYRIRLPSLGEVMWIMQEDLEDQDVL